ncbi:MAG: vWA domain-containing protein [Spirochaetia bacterium]|nr:vWA domain-containing protein [Spirochaetia bacterium]
MRARHFFLWSCLLILWFLALLVPVSAQQATAQNPTQLQLGAEDLILEQSLEGGYNLWIKAKPGIGSVLLTDSTADPEKRVSTYALRNPEYHPVNGDEKRMLDGEFLPSKERGLFSLIDSTPEEHPSLGEAFHIFIPYVVEYGYPWTREGELQILNGTWLNIRSFSKPYASYEGPFVDNPFVIEVVQRPMEPKPAEGDYMPDTVESYEEISRESNGGVTFGKGQEDIINNLRDVLRGVKAKSIDIVLCLDTTKSMQDDIPHLRNSLIPMLEEEIKGFDSFRLGIVLYRDYFELYLAKPYPFERDFSKIQAVLNRIRVYGGRDIPEAVYEALHTGIHSYEWRADKKLIVLVGDAPPHPRPRGKITKQIVYDDARERGIEIHTIILPH